MYKWGKTSLERMDGVSEYLTDCATKALSISQYDMTIPPHGGLRTPEEQNKLFKKGFSQLDGYKKKSYHQTGNALDVIPIQGYEFDKGFRHFAKCMFNSWQLMIYECEVPDYLYLEYGGHWGNFIDVPHWQIKQR